MHNAHSERRGRDKVREELSETLLLVTTGLLGDVPRAVPPRHALHERLELAISEQDRWTANEHGLFWTALLPELPRRGRRHSTDALSLAAAVLSREGFDEGRIAHALCVEVGTVRARASDDGRRGRASLERGHELLRAREAASVGAVLRRQIGTAWDPYRALPRVWRDGEEEPALDRRGNDDDLPWYFNPLVVLHGATREDPAAGWGDDPGADYLRLAAEALRTAAGRQPENRLAPFQA